MNPTTYESVVHDQNIPAKVLYIDIQNTELFTSMFKKDATYVIPPHWHRSLEVTYVVSGALQLRAGEKISNISTGDTFVVNSNILHELKSLVFDEGSVICLLISYDFLKKLIPSYDSLYFKMNENKQSYVDFGDKFSQILHYYKDATKINYIKITSLIYEIVFDLIQDHSEPRLSKHETNQKFIIDAIDYIHDHYKEELTLEGVSAQFSMSKEHFSRQFKKSIGSTYYDYLIYYRLYQAFPEIVGSNMTIDAISRKHGFPNSKSMITQFKIRYGETPLQFRKNYKISIIDHNTVS